MKNRQNLFWGIVIIVLLIGVLVFLYFKYETNDNYITYSYSNASVYATYSKRNVETGYKAYINNSVYSQGNTLRYGSLLLKLPINQTIVLTNFNLEDQNYYTSETNPTYIENTNNYRFNLKLVKPGELNVKFNEVGENIIRFNIESDGEYRHLSYCVKWSLHILTVQNVNEEIKFIGNPTIFEDFDKCYALDMDLNDNSTILEMEYDTFGRLDSRDFIEVVFFDGDYQRGIYVYEKLNDGEPQDICGENKKLIVPLKN